MVRDLYDTGRLEEYIGEKGAFFFAIGRVAVAGDKKAAHRRRV